MTILNRNYDPLFTPWKIGNVEIKNRFVMTSMGGSNLLGWMENKHIDKAGAQFILKFARNNCGLVLPGCQPICNPMFDQRLHKNDKMYEDLKKWIKNKSIARKIIRLGVDISKDAQGGVIDTDLMLEEIEKKVTNVTKSRTNSDYKIADVIFENVAKMIESNQENGTEITGVRTLYSYLDCMTTCFHR